MRHLGDITKINWDDVPPVDCVTGGSPCQDLSQAGLRAGLDGERSGLFMEEIRCVKELRQADVRRGRAAHLIRPRYLVWENVTGVYSSKAGADFQTVLTQIVRVKEPKAPPVPIPQNGWPHAGTLMGDGWSIAWRTHDSQYWGVPQRRRRCAVVADFNGRSAPEILFESACLPGDSQESGTQRKGTPGTSEEGIACTMLMREGKDGGGKGPLVQWGKSATLSTRNIQTVFQSRPHREPSEWGERMPDKDNFNCVIGVDCYNQATTGTVAKTLNSKATDSDHIPCVIEDLVVRRLTPLECERLQGFPDGWTDIGEWTDSKGKKRQCSDSQRYYAIGNSIALPFWKFLLKRISAQYVGTPTLGSLFDGIGGFPLCWEQINGKGTALWASEIEDFPIAVTKYRFGKED